MPESRPRNLEFEWDLIEHVARGLVDPYPLLEQMRFRAATLGSGYVDDPGRVRLDTDWLLEIRSELVDACNYAVWWLQEHPDHELAGRRLESLRALVTEFYVWSDQD